MVPMTITNFTNATNAKKNHLHVRHLDVDVKELLVSSK